MKPTHSLRHGSFLILRVPGLRLFFLVPRGWTDANLPLTISLAGEYSYQSKLAVMAKTAKPVHADITRVMIGRIEIVTPEERALLAQISSGSALVAFNDFETRKLNLPNNEAWNEVNSGKRTFAAIGFEVTGPFFARIFS